VTKASDNAYPSVLVTEGTVPTTPAAGKQRLYIDSTTHVLKVVNSSGTASNVGGAGTTIATDTIWDAAGDLVQGTGADTAAKLSAGTAGMFLKSAGAAAANLWAFPPGYELDYAQWTAGVNITATTEATANTIVTGGAVSYDGSTVVLIEFFIPASTRGTTYTQFWLYDGSSSIGAIGVNSGGSTGLSFHLSRRLTPSNASHTYSLRGSVDGATGTATGGAGGAGAYVPGFIRITKV
jgi:hypothetical protein